MKRVEAFDVARGLGHSCPRTFKTAGGRFYGTCGCGYRSATRTSEALAVQALIHHAMKAVREHRSNGG